MIKNLANYKPRPITPQPISMVKLFFTLCILLLLVPNSGYGIPACPDPAVVQQPDGTRITIYLKGDEYFHWNEDTGGFAILQRANGQWVYAREEDGKFVGTDYVVGQIDPVSVGLSKPNIARIRAAAERRWPRRVPYKQPGYRAPTTGTMKNLVVLVNFADTTITYSTDQFDSLFNESGYSSDGADGSVRDYYDEISYNSLTIQSTVVEPVTVDSGYFYYGEDFPFVDANLREMVTEALDALETRGFDFSTMDNDGDGWVDGLTFIHAGGGQEYTGNSNYYIWSKHYWLDSAVTYDGVSMKDFHTEPARRGMDSDSTSWGITRIGAICHENAHFLGLPDLYDRDGDSWGAGRFCLMALGCWHNEGITPAHMSAWCKYSLNWVTPAVISTPGVYSLSQVETNSSIYKLQGSFPSNEYFLVENRQGVGFDEYLPGSYRGILIWHVDENQDDNDDQTHYLVDLEEASGIQNLEIDPADTVNSNYGDDSDCFRSGNATDFTMCTTPGNKSYTGDALTLEISEVSTTSSNMSFRLSVTDFNDYVWVDFDYSGSENGSYSQPYSTLADGIANTPVGGKMAIKAGSTAETDTISKAMTIYGYCGGTIGE